MDLEYLEFPSDQDCDSVYDYNLCREAMQAHMLKKDSLVILATGTGKSIIYQLPALISPGVTICISPLVALQLDQVKALENKGIDAVCYNSSISQRQKEYIEEDLQEDEPCTKLLFLAPEALKSQKLTNLLLKLHARGMVSIRSLLFAL